MSPDEVARELVATDFVYKHTLYGELIEEFMKRVAARLREHYHLTWQQTWQVTTFYAPIALKLICVLMCDAAIPNLNIHPSEGQPAVFEARGPS